jgi:hypothetical protein
VCLEYALLEHLKEIDAELGILERKYKDVISVSDFGCHSSDTGERFCVIPEKTLSEIAQSTGEEESHADCLYPHSDSSDEDQRSTMSPFHVTAAEKGFNDLI